MSNSDDILFNEAFKMQKILMEVLNKATIIKMTAEYYDGATARWIEREMNSLVKIIGDGLVND